MITAQQAVTYWESYFDTNTGLSGNALLIMLDSLNKEIDDKLRGVNTSKRIVSTTISVSEGTLTYTLPADYETTAYVGCGLYDGSDIEHFYQVNSSGQLTLDEKLPQGTYTFRYLSQLPTLTSLSDETVVPERYKKVLIYGLDREIAVRDDDTLKEGNADQRYQRELGRMLSNIRDISPVYSLSDPTNPF